MKKYIDKLKDLKKTNKKLFIGIISLFIFVGVTFAFVAAQISGEAFKLFNLGAQTTDQLEFVVDKDLSLTATQFNFTEGGQNVFDTSIATAKLKANSTKNTASYNYNVYLVIEENEFKYTTSDKKTEILLQVTDPNGNSLTTLDGLTYNTTLQGFDITEFSDVVTIANNYAITSSSSENYTTQNWTFTVTFINLDTNQKENAGKELIGKILIQRNELVLPDVTFAIRHSEYKAGASTANLNCNKDGVRYDLKNGEYRVSSLNGRTKCIVDYEKPATKTYLNDYIMELETTAPTQGEGKIVHETFTKDSATIDTGYRYEGQDPNNYVWFNNELWRIIGVMNEGSHGVTNANLVKIIRNESIGGLVWNTSSSSNNWNTSSLKSLLNTEYLNSRNGTNGNNCYGYSTTSKAKCDYRITGIKEVYRGMIKEVTWYLGGYSSQSVTAEAMYEYERDETSKYSSNLASVTAKIGLMYVSDYGYAVPSEKCSRTIEMGATIATLTYKDSSCSLNNWLYIGLAEKTITPSQKSYNNAFSIAGSADLKINVVYSGESVRPTLYLESNVYVIGGNGSITDPYIIGM